MTPLIITNPPRANLATVTALTDYGVATVHEALGRTGYLGPHLRPLYPGPPIAGTAITVLCWPGDNLMIHAAIEHTQPGDILVVTTTSPNTDGAFGELLATTLQHRGVRGLITTTGIRDTTQLHTMNFPVWSPTISAQGTVKNTPGSVNTPITIAGQHIHPGDAILADNDGAMVIPRHHTHTALTTAQTRAHKEQATRQAFRNGTLGLDHYNLRPKLTQLGIQYLTAEEYGL
ncbi:4-carboxy-4-hydroxy-2-oxoadipate aldolase/oxaloacetate decarboxylase [Amycolatopsis sp. K13G38]|uniref:Putative 4-hydroxy-4-methyl-2-oxoglutarate aldolase n=1 Tax=Amycolatopsis acididurans TaxID=2724524 RepID=A0ABX1IZ90_9PSEU|nr:4-carboxy-4-hydroxy-2-oxoadipate aldolase/oxaloacetate decarboxylase [Amycolatopsis acididurans]NKQ51361.1 4-carboxy-4-hydroxy-2-oxoadipate aldolase/oxaloacetate decarboxylase [Amycolatopsis acididurans]